MIHLQRKIAYFFMYMMIAAFSVSCSDDDTDEDKVDSEQIIAKFKACFYSDRKVNAERLTTFEPTEWTVAVDSPEKPLEIFTDITGIETTLTENYEYRYASSDGKCIIRIVGTSTASANGTYATMYIQMEGCEEIEMLHFYNKDKLGQLKKEEVLAKFRSYFYSDGQVNAERLTTFEPTEWTIAVDYPEKPLEIFTDITGNETTLKENYEYGYASSDGKCTIRIIGTSTASANGAYATMYIEMERCEEIEVLHFYNKDKLGQLKKEEVLEKFRSYFYRDGQVNADRLTTFEPTEWTVAVDSSEKPLEVFSDITGIETTFTENYEYSYESFDGKCIIRIVGTSTTSANGTYATMFILMEECEEIEVLHFYNKNKLDQLKKEQIIANFKSIVYRDGKVYATKLPTFIPTEWAVAISSPEKPLEVFTAITGVQVILKESYEYSYTSSDEKCRILVVGSLTASRKGTYATMYIKIEGCEEIEQLHFCTPDYFNGTNGVSWGVPVIW